MLNGGNSTVDNNGNRKEITMSEIEKLYKNAGVLKECLSPCYINKTWRKTHDCPNCDNRENYPPFTAEKQIELIKFISGWNMFLKNDAGQFYIATGDNVISYYAENLENAICLCINSKWQLMNEEEKQQVKGILE